MLKKNDSITCEIIDISSDGNGVAKYEGITVFVPMTAVGDVCQVKILKVHSSYCFAKVESIITPSADRIQPKCPNFAQCGGCDFMHITYEAEKIAKQKFVQACFNRMAKLDCQVNPVLSCKSHERYRNKAQFPLACDANGKAVTGFYAQRSHRVIPALDCLLQPDLMNEIAQYTVSCLNLLKIKPYNEETRTGIMRHIYLRTGWVSGQVMLCLVARKENVHGIQRLVNMVVEKFPCITTVVLNVNSQNTNVILGEKNITLHGDGFIFDTLCGVDIALSPHSFYQVNHDGAQQLYRLAQEALNLNKNDILLDLYCGAGSIGLSMAHQVNHLVGVEIVPQAVENAKANAEKHGVKNARFICADAAQAAAELVKEGFCPTAVVVDPPRKGCDENTLQAMISMRPEKIAMISCNPATAARDCKYLTQNGYEIQSVQPFDMFPRTKHVETVIMMTNCGDKAKNEA